MNSCHKTLVFNLQNVNHYYALDVIVVIRLPQNCNNMKGAVNEGMMKAVNVKQLQRVLCGPQGLANKG